MEVFGATRSRVTSRYALITPDSHVVSPLVDWRNSSAVFHVSPELGARFNMYTALMRADGRSEIPDGSVQRMVYVLEGEVRIECDGVDGNPMRDSLTAGGFAYFPAGAGHEITSGSEARLLVFEKTYVRHRDFGPPGVVIGHESRISEEPFLGDPDARLRTLLPNEPSFDMAVNVFTYRPGATLPQVEVHVMEHGLLMLEGSGVYLLGDDFHPVTAGDVIWMASYCPQWFVAMGKRPARYVYYKDVHRDGIGAK